MSSHASLQRRLEVWAYDDKETFSTVEQTQYLTKISGMWKKLAIQNPWRMVVGMSPFKSMAKAWSSPFPRSSSAWLRKAIISRKKLLNTVGGGWGGELNIKNKRNITSPIQSFIQWLFTEYLVYAGDKQWTNFRESLSFLIPFALSKRQKQLAKYRGQKRKSEKYHLWSLFSWSFHFSAEGGTWEARE